MIEIEILKDARKARLKNLNVFERKHEFKTDIQRSKGLLKILGGDLGRKTTHTYIGEVGNFIGFKF
jgi:hypothetical protein